jgi:two-component sensor histidine kinase
VYDNGKGADLKAVNDGFGFKLIESLASYQLKGIISCFNQNGLHHKIIFPKEFLR